MPITVTPLKISNNFSTPLCQQLSEGICYHGFMKMNDPGISNQRYVNYIEASRSEGPQELRTQVDPTDAPVEVVTYVDTRQMQEDIKDLLDSYSIHLQLFGRENITSPEDFGKDSEIREIAERYDWSRSNIPAEAISEFQKSINLNRFDLDNLE